MPDFIPSPYNFAPLPKKLFFPDEDNPNLPTVSHDKPFSDGISGSIDLEAIAETPVFIRGHDEKSPLFCTDPSGRFIIPGSSIKGALRNVFSVLTASALDCHNRRYSLRDLYNQKDYMRYMTNNGEPTVQAGWLSKKGRQWWITPCDFEKIPQETLEEISAKQGNRKPDFGSKQSAEGKYNKWDQNNQSREIKLSSGIVGTVVFTGQPSNRRRNNPKDKAKKHEFVFFNREDSDRTQVPDHIAENFRRIHSEARPAKRDEGNPNSNTEASKEGHANEEWSYWKEVFDNGGDVPVFYLAYEGGTLRPKQKSKQLDGNSDDLYAFGLAMMFRLPYQHDIHYARNQSAPDSYAQRVDPENSLRDMTEAVFGYVDGNSALRGRVAFEPLVNTNEAVVLSEVAKLLSEPRPSFYPNYIKQNPANGTVNQLKGHNYSTLHTEEAELRGFKRYPVQNDADSNNSNSKNASRFKPLEKGASFAGTVFFHNLRPFELGALLWTICLGNSKQKVSPYRHSIGLAKPYGYGQMRLEVRSIKTTEGNDIQADKMTEAFEKTLAQTLPGWMQSPTISELLAMADPEKTPPPERLRYPELPEFSTFKGSRNPNRPAPALFLEPYRKQIPVDSESIGSALEKPIQEEYKIGQEVEVEAFNQKKNKKKKTLRWQIRVIGNQSGDTTGYLEKSDEETLGDALKKGWNGRATITNNGKGQFSYKLLS